MSNYEERTELVFLNIDNIHVMRNSLEEMHALLKTRRGIASS